MSGVCPKCGSDNPPGASFCGQCGFMLGSAPGGPGLERLKPPADAESSEAVPAPAPGEVPHEGEGAFPEGTEGQGIWASHAQGPGTEQPPPAYPASYPVPNWAGTDYVPGAMNAPPAPAKPDNTVKIILWSVGACCGCSLLLFVGLVWLGWYLEQQEKVSGGDTAYGDSAQPADGSESLPNAGNTAAASGYQEALALAGHVEAASEQDVANWAYEQQLGEYYMPQDALVFACAEGNAAVVKYFLDSGRATPSEISETYGATPIHSATFNNCLECVAVLIAGGADVNQNLSGDMGTPLHQAALGDAVDTARLLLSCGADVEALNGLGTTALHDAANSNAVNVAQLLISSGAEVDKPTMKEGNTALLLAANMGSLDIGRVLIEAGANVNFADPQFGLTALHLAALKGDTDFVQLLLESGANPYLKANDGQKPQDSALAGGFAEVAEMLK